MSIRWSRYVAAASRFHALPSERFGCAGDSRATSSNGTKSTADAIRRVMDERLLPIASITPASSQTGYIGVEAFAYSGTATAIPIDGEIWLSSFNGDHVAYGAIPR